MDVKVYTTITCPYCAMVKQFLTEHSVSFQERDVNANKAYAQELVTTTGQMGVPVTVIDGEAIVGFDRPRLEQIINQKRAEQHPVFGASIADAVKITTSKGQEVFTGAYLGSVKPNSFAARTGLMPGDIITGLNSTIITNSTDLAQSLFLLNRGSHVTITFRRGPQPLTTEGIFKD